jgi:hypothetical protein
MLKAPRRTRRKCDNATGPHETRAPAKAGVSSRFDVESFLPDRPGTQGRRIGHAMVFARDAANDVLYLQQTRPGFHPRRRAKRRCLLRPRATSARALAGRRSIATAAAVELMSS